MARPRKATCCSTCRQRKVKCDGRFPRCENCAKGRRHCSWAAQPASQSRNEKQPPPTQAISNETLQTQDADPSTEISLPTVDITDPREALADEQVAHLFRHYVQELAPWYDLLDSHRLFADRVPYLALDNPLVFNAILAFSAVHLGYSADRTQYKRVAEQYHLNTVRLLLDIVNRVDTAKLEETIAATCLLTSFEIIADYPGEKSHLQGTHLFLSSQSISVNHDLISAGFWNYLREDISMALIDKRGLKIDLACFQLDQDASCEDCHANYVSYLLGDIINACFRKESEGPPSKEALDRLQDSLEEWKSGLPDSFRPFSSAWSSGSSCFPRKWFLRDWHAAAMQYYHVARSILLLSNPDLSDTNTPSTPTSPGSNNRNIWHRINQMKGIHASLEHHATQVCAIAIASDSSSVWVNSFGPIAFCGIWINDHMQRDDLVRHLRKWGSASGWPIERHVAALRDSWRGRDPEPATATTERGEVRASEHPLIQYWLAGY